MTLWSRLHSWLRVTLRRSRAESEMDAELRFHLEAYAEDLARGGVPPREGMRRARLEFGAIEEAKEECRDARGANLVETWCRTCAMARACCARIRASRLRLFLRWPSVSAPRGLVWKRAGTVITCCWDMAETFPGTLRQRTLNPNAN
jgi:hypothetical protein